MRFFNLKNVCWITICCWLVACKNENKNGAAFSDVQQPPLTTERLAGNWVAKSFVNRVKTMNSVAQSLKSPSMPFCLAFTLAPEIPDSMMCYTGEKYWRLPLKFKKDTLIVPAGKDGAPILLVYSEKPERSFMVYDYSSGKLVQNYFVALKEKTTNGLSAFFAALNFDWTAGSYKMAGSKNDIVFAPTGVVTGLPGVDIYQICLGGKCQIAGDKVDLMYLMSNKEQLGQWHAFHFLEDGERLQIFELKKNTEPQPEWLVGNLKYDLTRVKEEKK